MKVRRIKLGGAVSFYIKWGGLGRSMNCAPLPPLLTPIPHSSLFAQMIGRSYIFGDVILFLRRTFPALPSEPIEPVEPQSPIPNSEFLNSFSSLNKSIKI